MMKKMLVLALVLAVAGLANAGLSLTLTGTDQINVVSNDTAAYTATVTWTPALNDAAPAKPRVTSSGLTASILATPGFINTGDAPALTNNGIVDLAEEIDGVPSFPALKALGYGQVQMWSLAIGSSVVGALQPGTSYTANFDLAAGQYLTLQKPAQYVAQVDLMNGDLNAVIGTAYIAVPEPMTMGLLALGALFLRKK